MTGRGMPLDGVRVVEMTHMVMGPTCGMILAQLGAEVIKVEPSVGDKTRSLGGMGTSFFPLFNRGKRSVVLDFAKVEDRETMHRLLESADVFLENFRDGQLEMIVRGVEAKEIGGEDAGFQVAGCDLHDLGLPHIGLRQLRGIGLEQRFRRGELG